jgi:ribonuclease HI
MSEPAKMHIDGASRGNPGRAAYAVVLARPGHAVVEEADVIGTATNNVAEYTALLKGLELAHELGVTRLAVFSDSELMMKQMNGEYKVKHADMRPLYERACALRAKFAEVTLTHVRREQNKRADLIGNEALDGKPRKRGQGGALPSTSQGEVTATARPTPPAPLPEGRGETDVTLRSTNEEAGSSFAERSEASSSGPPLPSGRGARGVGSSARSTTCDDSSVRPDALQCLADAARHWAEHGLKGLPPEAVWDQLWSLIAEAGLLKKKAK